MTNFRRLKDKEVKALLREFDDRYPKAPKMESAKVFDEVSVGEGAVYFVDGSALILRTRFGLLPSLKFQDILNSLPRVIVDMGAVAHVVNGADLMRPGIRSLQDFAKGDLLLIVDEKYGKPIALGVADFDSATMGAMVKGKIIVNVHYVGDELWKSFSKPG